MARAQPPSHRPEEGCGAERRALLTPGAGRVVTPRGSRERSGAAGPGHALGPDSVSQIPWLLGWLSRGGGAGTIPPLPCPTGCVRFVAYLNLRDMFPASPPWRGLILCLWVGKLRCLFRCTRTGVPDNQSCPRACSEKTGMQGHVTSWPLQRSPCSTPDPPALASPCHTLPSGPGVAETCSGWWLR